MADPDLYKAALEYHETEKFDGPEEQLKLRRFYFEFEPTEDEKIKIEHTAKGTLLTNEGPATFVTCVANVNIKLYGSIPFTFCLNHAVKKQNIAQIR